MAKDVNELVLDAFRVEHREQLEQIRTLLGSLDPGASVADDPRVQDAFRLAHSFKGGARVCDLREAERLGHGLETVLEHLSHGDLLLTENALATVNIVLDCIEDWMAALDQRAAASRHFGCPGRHRARVSGRFCSGRVDVRSGKEVDATASSLPQRARTTLRSTSTIAGPLEQQRRCSRRRGAVPKLPEWPIRSPVRQPSSKCGPSKPWPGDWSSYSSDLRTNQQRLDAVAQRQIEEWLDAMAETMRGVGSGPEATQQLITERQVRRSVRSSRCLLMKTTPRRQRRRTCAKRPHQPAATAYETVRVSVESLDRLMRSSSEMLADNQHVARITRQLSALQLEVNDLEREREAIRRVAPVEPPQVGGDPGIWTNFAILGVRRSASERSGQTHPPAVGRPSARGLAIADTVRPGSARRLRSPPRAGPQRVPRLSQDGARPGEVGRQGNRFPGSRHGCSRRPHGLAGTQRSDHARAPQLRVARHRAVRNSGAIRGSRRAGRYRSAWKSPAAG